MRRMTYAVRWRENDGPEFAGGLAFERGGLELSGTAAGRPTAHRELHYGDVRELYLDRLHVPALVLVMRDGDRVAIGSLQGLGALHELADRVAAGRSEVAG